MIFQFSDGEFSDPIATSLKMWKKINSFIVIRILRHFREIEQKSTIFFHAFFFSPPLENLLRGPWYYLILYTLDSILANSQFANLPLLSLTLLILRLATEFNFVETVCIFLAPSTCTTSSYNTTASCQVSLKLVTLQNHRE